MTTARVLVVDDDPVTRDLLRGVLTRAGHDVREAPDGKAGLRALYERTPDVVVLDVEMPELDGWQTLARIRDVSDVPVLMLTAKQTELEKVRGLQGGADDYVVKPFGHQELLARIGALLRRRAGEDQSPGLQSYADGRIEIDYGRRLVSCDGHEATLTPLEFRLLRVFVEHPNQVLSKDQLLALVWNDELTTSLGQVKLYVGYLRRKLDPKAPLKTPIETVRGFGYMYRRPE